MKGNLYIVATPIGNLEDITLRAIKILKEVDLIAAEDTRHTLKLLNHLEIKKPLVSYYKQIEYTKTESLIEKLLEVKNIALVSDAGTPAISDPGEVIVKKAIEYNINEKGGNRKLDIWENWIIFRRKQNQKRNKESKCQ